MTEIQQLEAKIDEQHQEYLKSGYDPVKKLEALQLLKDYIIQYLSLVKHADKFKFPTISMVLEESVEQYGLDFKAVEAGAAFEFLSKYAQNLIEEPWREEYKVIRLSSGFFVHKVSSYLVYAHRILELMGYEKISNTEYKFKPTLTTPAEFDTLKRISRDLLVASQECIILGNIFDVVYHAVPYDVSILKNHVFLHRQHYTGDVYAIARLILDRINPNNQPTTINAQNDTQTQSQVMINNTQNQSQISTTTASTTTTTANNNVNYNCSAFSNNKNYQSQSQIETPPALVKTKVSVEDLARCLNAPKYGLSFGVIDETKTKSTEMDADKVYAEALEYNCKVNEPFMNNSRQSVNNACTSTTCDKKGFTTTKCDGSGSVSNHMPMDTNSNEHRPLDLDTYFYNTIISRSKVPGHEAEIERVPLSYLNISDRGDSNLNSKAIARFPEPINHIPEKQFKLSNNNNEENRREPAAAAPTVVIDKNKNDGWVCSHCTFTNYTSNQACFTCGGYRKSENDGDNRME